MSLVISFLMILLVVPLLNGAATSSQTLLRDDRDEAGQFIERSTLVSALNSAVIAIDRDGGARQMQQDFPEAGLTVYTLTRPEPIAGQTYPLIRVWSTARPLREGSNSNVSTNNNLSATLAYDPINRIVTQVRFIEKQRSQR